MKQITGNFNLFIGKRNPELVLLLLNSGSISKRTQHYTFSVLFIAVTPHGDKSL
jgi:hypothetical protein